MIQIKLRNADEYMKYKDSFFELVEPSTTEINVSLSDNAKACLAVMETHSFKQAMLDLEERDAGLKKMNAFDYFERELKNHDNTAKL